MKLDQPFYPMTPETARKLRKAELTAAEWRFWSYLIELDQWGDRYLDLNPATVMAECKMSKPTYYRAKAKLQELGLFDFREEKVSFKNLTGVSKMRQQSQKFNSSLKNDTDSLKNETDNIKNETTTPLKPAQGEDSELPQTSSDFSDFLQTLSEAERESFLKFSEEKAKAMPNPPQLVDAWIAVHYLDLHKQFVKSAAGREAKKEAIAAQFDWRNDPRFTQWLWEAFNRGYEWVHEDEAEREQRNAFYDWALKVNAYLGICYEE